LADVHLPSYWTDHGACYHYNTGNLSNYEEAILAAKEHTEEAGIPYRYLQACYLSLYIMHFADFNNYTIECNLLSSMAVLFEYLPQGIKQLVCVTHIPLRVVIVGQAPPRLPINLDSLTW